MTVDPSEDLAKVGYDPLKLGLAVFPLGAEQLQQIVPANREGDERWLACAGRK